MAIPQFLMPVLRELVRELVRGNYQELETDGRIGRLTADELQRAVADYGRTLIELPDEAFQTGDVYPLEGKEIQWAIELDLWTLEEGRSDLTLALTARKKNGSIELEIDDLHVL